MAEEGSSSTSGGSDLLDLLEDTLTDLTKGLIPGYMSKIQDTNPTELGSVMSDLLATVMTKELKDKSLAKMLGHLAIVATAQLKASQTLVEQLTEEVGALKVKNKATKQSLATANARVTELEVELDTSGRNKAPIDEEKIELKQKAEELEKSLQERDEMISEVRAQLDDVNRSSEESENLLRQASEEVKDLRSQVRAHNHFRDAGVAQLHDMHRQLAEAHVEIRHLQEQQQLKDAELAEVQRDLKHLRVDHSPGQNHLPIPPGIKEKTPPLGGVSGSLAPQPFPTLPVEISTDHRAPEGPTEPQRVTVSYPSRPPSTLNHLQRPSRRDLDKIARNIGRFEPIPGGTHNTTTYLRDIDYFLQEFSQVSVQDKIYLIKLTSSQEVSSFIDRQTPYVLNDYRTLCEYLVEEFDNPLSQEGLTAALEIKQGKQEPPQAYYIRLRKAYFGRRNEPGMEEDSNFKQLFIEHLHPKTSYHLGVSACPLTMTSRQLRELAMRGFAKEML